MSAPLPVRIVGSAARSIAEVAAWWTENRPKAPDAFVDDLESTLTLIASHPDIGATARNAKLENVRRVHLARAHYYLYYRVTSEPSTSGYQVELHCPFCLRLFQAEDERCWRLQNANRGSATTLTGT